MRKFRFVGNSNHYSSPYVKGKIYDSNFKFHEDYDNVGISASLFEDDWEEVFEEEPIITDGPVTFTSNLKNLHKDTDLGYFAGLAMQGILANPKIEFNNDPEATFESFANYCIDAAQELIKQLDKQNR